MHKVLFSYGLISALWLSLFPVISYASDDDAQGQTIRCVIVINAEYHLTTVTTFSFHFFPSGRLMADTNYLEERVPGLPACLNDTKEVSVTVLERHKTYYCTLLRVWRLTFRSFCHQCINELKTLITNAQNVIPLAYRWTTSLLLIATNGLRYVSKPKTEILLDAIREFFNTTGLRVDENSVLLMEKRRMTLMWLTLNLILGRLQYEKYETATLLDLSTTTSGLAYVPNSNDSMPLWRWKNVFNITAFGRKFEFYNYSFPNLGINDARLLILLQDETECKNVILSDCIHPNVNFTWTHRNRTYKIQGAPTRKLIVAISKKACLRRINTILDERANDFKLVDKEIYATSYYYRAAVTSQMVPKGENINITVEDYLERAKLICDIPFWQQPFMCMDLLYIYTLLRRVYGLTADTIVRLVTELGGHEVKWPLGAAFEKYQGEINGILTTP